MRVGNDLDAESDIGPDGQYLAVMGTSPPFEGADIRGASDFSRV